MQPNIESSHKDQRGGIAIDTVLIGSGGHARVVVEILEAMGGFAIKGVLTKDKMKKFMGYPVLGSDDELGRVRRSGVVYAAIGVGGYRDNVARRRVFRSLKDLDFRLATAVHPSAVVASSVTIGEGSVIFPGVVVNSGVSIGKNVIVATGATVDHDSFIADNALISAGVTVGANVTIGDGALLAIGSTVISGQSIGEDALVAAGAVVVAEVPKYTTVVGIPARPMKRG